MIVRLVRASRVLEDTTSTALAKPIVLSSLKAIKTSVLCNVEARCRYRSAGVFSYLKDILDAILKGGEQEENDAEDKMLVEQVFTTLAAICFVDDLNALQASTIFKVLMNRTKSVYCDEGDDHESSLDQKLEYLEKLFITIDEEQSDLFSYLEKISERGTFDKGIDSDDNRNDDDGMILINEEELGGNLMREQDNEEEGDGMQHNGDSDNDIVPEVDHDQRQEAMSEIIYEDGTAINHDHDHSITYSGDHIDDDI